MSSMNIYENAFVVMYIPGQTAFSINSQGTFIDAICSLISPRSFSDAPVYLSSQSYMADSSLSEEMSQFDFSTGVQSFSYNSQNPSGGSSRTRVRLRRDSFFFFLESRCYRYQKVIYNFNE